MLYITEYILIYNSKKYVDINITEKKIQTLKNITVIFT